MNNWEYRQVTIQQGKQRLDRALASHFPDLSRSRLQKLIEQGNITVDGVVVTNKKSPVQGGEEICVSLPPLQPLNLEPEFIPLDVLYEDEQLIIINKPAGLVVHPAPGNETGTLVNALLAHCDHLAGIGGVERPGIVHRLDKDTSGAIVVAKTDFSHQSLQAQIQEKTAIREYMGIVHGSPKEEIGVINLPIGRHPIHRKKMAVVEKGGRNAITHWWVEQRLGNYTLMGFRLETGRTHQIRVHCAAMGHPIVGDPVYSRGKSLYGVKLSGQILHARKLELTHPVTAEKISAIAPLPPEFTKLMN
ncbi:RluA family pseudouridine synthase [Euhalothece natronophila Z-M001]|uniref:Pseudouridine synthase n=1 Tax=Euhalothece natronophila Z-M001 TaxID=522448 RepID=A0A5B8NKB7_9CHRO|nr:RluA family pseudouridine synthase [Euhalothece natronophila]QDZ39692.1 RluA family pseudouridine synthase [Euhalothece natronophila Z-M001]